MPQGGRACAPISIFTWPMIFPAHRLPQRHQASSAPTPPHRHLDANKDEPSSCCAASGALCFDDRGHVRQHWLLTAGGDCWESEIPWRLAYGDCPAARTVIEAKSGPYCLLPEEKGTMGAGER